VTGSTATTNPGENASGAGREVKKSEQVDVRRYRSTRTINATKLHAKTRKKPF